MDIKIEIECPECDSILTERPEGLTPGRRLKCPGCRTPILVKGDDLGEVLDRLAYTFSRGLLGKFEVNF
jgi:DNA-directed RNA polymerase subunit RPC12/RpoP